MSMSRPIFFSIRGIPIRLGRVWLIIVVILTCITASAFAPRDTSASDAALWYAAAGVVALACVASLLLHEFAHAWAAERSGERIIHIDPAMFGALSDESFHPETPRSDAMVAAAGPVVSLALGTTIGCAWLVMRDAGTLLPTVIGFVALTNVCLGIGNLLPAFPLDGGRILRAFVWFLTGDLITGSRVASIYGNFLALVGLITGGVLLSLGHPLSIWGAWTVLAFWMVNREGREGHARTVWREASRTMTIEDAGLANSSRVSASRSIDDAIDDLLHGVSEGPMLVAGPDREIVGIVSLAQVRRVPRALWPERCVEEVSVSLDGLERIGSDAPVMDLLDLFDRTRADLVLVDTRGHITGALDVDTVYTRVRARVHEERLDRQSRRK